MMTEAQHNALLEAALREDMQALPALLAAAPHNSLWHFARHVFHTKERVPDRACLLPQLEDDLRQAALTSPPVLAAKIRYLHLLLARQQQTEADLLLQDILTFPLAARDAELLAVVLHSGGRTSAGCALLSRMLPQITQAEDAAVLTGALARLLAAGGQQQLATQLSALTPPATHPMLHQWQQPLPAVTNTSQPPVTVIITTNISPKFKYNQASAPPSAAMLRQTLGSFYNQLQAPRDWPLVIYFDEPRDPSMAESAAEYRTALESVAADYNARLEFRPGHGLRRNFVEAVQSLNTPYYFFLEHDWTFSADAPPVTTLLATLQQHPELNVIRYNYNFNHLQRHDYALIPYATKTGLPLLTGAYYCNNPSLVRTVKMQRDWLPLLTDNQHDLLNGGAGGVEEVIYLHMLRLVKACGILPVIDAMGCTVTGTAGNTPRAIHNGI